MNIKLVSLVLCSISAVAAHNLQVNSKKTTSTSAYHRNLEIINNPGGCIVCPQPPPATPPPQPEPTPPPVPPPTPPPQPEPTPPPVPPPTPPPQPEPTPPPVPPPTPPPVPEPTPPPVPPPTPLATTTEATTTAATTTTPDGCFPECDSDTEECQGNVCVTVCDPDDCDSKHTKDSECKNGKLECKCKDDYHGKTCDKEDKSDDSGHIVYYEYEELVDEDTSELAREIACVDPILCSEAVANFMRHFLGNARRLFDVVVDQCNEPDIVEAWGAGNDFAAFRDDDDDLDCIITEATDTLLGTTATRTLRGLLAEFTVDDLGLELSLKERDVCGHSEEEIECMDQWRCNIEEKCAEEILNGEDNCFGILDYVTACYIWCVEIL